ncbi:tetratricopeptide repeat protein 16 isoform X1 [Oncorhynchus keta]|uniref:tetratricopeptide repeat protein 16 isoform X1 n=2 Tax=Oncorhynchus keta TaxID=8018 RepID=UPI0015FE39AF|nr:tetratricopeptide repeat protein 16 isoform X1 [Oncorhynchus keta]
MSVPALKMDQQVDDDTVLFPTAVSEEVLVEARRKHAICRLFGSSSIFLSSESRRGDRPDLVYILTNKAIEHYENGEEAMAESQFSKAVTFFTKAIHLQPKQTQLYVSQAEAYLQLCDFQSAVVSYRHACLLEPHTKTLHTRLAFIYYLQGQCLYDKGMFLDALESFAKAAELKPSCRSYHMRSLACLTALGRYTDCLRLVSNWLEADSQTADLFTLRARLHKQLNQVKMCYHDLRSALILSPSCPEAGALLGQLEEASERARQQAVSRALAGELTEALSKINTALEHCPETGRHYLFRGILYRRLKEFTAAIEDLVLAVELSEAGDAGDQGSELSGHTQEDWRAVQGEAQVQLVLTYNDFAVQCFSRSFYTEAVLLLNKAIQEQKEESGLYINRGDCFFKQDEWEFALADYQQAKEISPDDQVIRIRLAVIHNTLGTHCYQDRKYQEAADKFSEAINYNPGVSRYYENRAKAHSKLPNVEGAKQDAISTLILDPTNDQVVPLLLSLFPGCSVSDILSSETARTVKAQLMDSIQACKQSTSSVLRAVAQVQMKPYPGLQISFFNRESQLMCSELDKITLSHDADSQSDSQSSEDQFDQGAEPLKARVAPQEVYQQIVRINQQVKRAVRLALEWRQPLHYDGPHLSPGCTVEQEQSALGSKDRPYHWRKFGGFGVNSK